MANKTLRVGIIGIGVFSVFAHVPDLRATGRADLVAISRRNPERLAMAQEKLGVPHAYTDWREMLDRTELDAVIVSTPHHLHVEPTLAALARGLHVMVEKPMALRSDDAWSMVDAADRAGRVLMVGYPNRTDGTWRTIKQMIDQGEIGQLRQISMSDCSFRRWFWQSERLPDHAQALLRQGTGMPDAFFSDWGLAWHRKPAEMGGGAFTDIGTHLVDLLLWLAGSPAGEVAAFTEKADMPVESFITVQSRLANGVLLSLSWADAVPRGLLDGDRSLLIVGEDGTITDDAEGGIWFYRNGKRTKVEPAFPTQSKASVFVCAILDGTKGYPTAREGAHAVEFIEALYRSAAEGRIVKLERNQGAQT